MNSELKQTLENLLTSLKSKRAYLQDENRKNNTKKAELIEVEKTIDELENDLEYSRSLDEKINNYEELISKTKAKKDKEMLNADLDTLKEQAEIFNSGLEEKYADLEIDEKKSSNKKGIVISAVAVLAALGIGFGIGSYTKNSGKTEYKENTTTVTETQKPTGAPRPTETPVVKEGFTDINDAEALAERAEEIVEYFDKLTPASGMTLEKAEEFLKYINNGVVENPTYDDAAFVIDTINNLMVAELAHASDVLNEVETERENKGVLVDYSKFFLDGTQGQKLASEITRLRQAMITNASTDVSKYRKEFTELFMKSWILNGYNGEVINAYALEYPGMEALIDLEFLNTCILVGEAKDMVVDNPITMEPMSLKEMQAIANYEECPTGLIDENGVEAGMITLDKSSSDLYAMYTHALLNNRDLNENFGKTLTK